MANEPYHLWQAAADALIIVLALVALAAQPKHKRNGNTKDGHDAQ